MFTNIKSFLRDKIIAPLLAAPRRFSGGVLENRFGWQWWRIFWFNILRYPRFLIPVPTEAKKYAADLARDGAVIIPNFLPDEAFKELYAAFERALPKIVFKPMVPEYLPPETRVQLSKGRLDITPAKAPELHALMEKYFLNNALLNRIAFKSVGRRKKFKTPILIQNRNVNPDLTDRNGASFYHFDVSYPAVKMFFYLGDVDAGNGATIYAKGTNHLPLARLWYDYKKSVLWAKKRKENPAREGDDTGKGWHSPTDREEKDLGIIDTPMEGKANSVVIFNVMGFHKQGQFRDTRTREFIELSYR